MKNIKDFIFEASKKWSNNTNVNTILNKLFGSPSNWEDEDNTVEVISDYLERWLKKVGNPNINQLELYTDWDGDDIPENILDEFENGEVLYEEKGYSDYFAVKQTNNLFGAAFIDSNYIVYKK